MQQNRSRQASEQQIMEQLWLGYFNDTLYEKGIITETARNRMRVQIKARDRGR